MNLTLQRTEQSTGYTLGTLAVDGAPYCLTLEDEVRPDGQKIPGATAIPPGRYRIVVDYSPRFGRAMPHVLDVPGFAGVRIHTGNTVADTQGCILVGMDHIKAMLLRSREAYRPLLAKISDAIEDKQQVWMDVLPAKEETAA